MSMFDYTVEDATPLEAVPLTRDFETAIRELIIKESEKVVVLERFTEDPEQLQDEREYPRKGTDAGLVVIFNQHEFEGSFNARTGTNRDVNELILTFSRLGFNIDPYNVHNDLRRDEILAELKKLSNEDHSHRNCLVIVILTHGDKGEVLESKDSQMYTSEIWEPFSACESLKGKPKFFIFQACKGESYSKHDSTKDIDIIPKSIYTKVGPDMLIAFSAVEGSQSQRHMFLGTWFVQEMCRNFAAFGRREDVVSLLIRTSKCVTRNYYHLSDKEESQLIKKQMPLFVSTLKKKFYLSRSKERNYILQQLKQTQMILSATEEILKKETAQERRTRMQRWK